MDIVIKRSALPGRCFISDSAQPDGDSQILTRQSRGDWSVAWCWRQVKKSHEQGRVADPDEPVAAIMVVEAILQLCREGQHELVTSYALRIENSRNPNVQRKEFAEASLALAAHDLPHSAPLEQRAAVWQNAGVGLLDALHLASAEQAGAEVIATCDDMLMKWATDRKSVV